jgi:hypothetical protein
VLDESEQRGLDLAGRAARTLIQESIAWLDHDLRGTELERSPMRIYLSGAEDGEK